MNKIILTLALAAVSSLANIPYSNTTTDQQFSIFYSTGYTQIGDQIHMTSASNVSSVNAQFFNDGSDTTFDAVLQFYQVGGPVGTQIGSSFITTGISIASNMSQTVDFTNLGNLFLPQDVIVVLSVRNVGGGGDVGVNFFDPPTAGTSDNSFFIINDGTGFSQATTNMGIDNIYLEVSNTPEPSTAVLSLGGLLVFASVCVMRRKLGASERQ
jgi:hypothetical protein